MDGNQNQPQQPQQPVQAETGSLEDQMAAEMENSRLIEEQQAQMAMANAAAENDKKKGNMGMLIGLIVAVVLALGGIGFGVFATIQKANDADSYEKQIASLKKTNAELSDQLAEVAETAGDLDNARALKILQTAELGMGGEYSVEYARVDECYNTNGAISCRVAYVTRIVDGSLIEREITLVEDENGEWSVGEIVTEPPVEAVEDDIIAE